MSYDRPTATELINKVNTPGVLGNGLPPKRREPENAEEAQETSPWTEETEAFRSHQEWEKEFKAEIQRRLDDRMKYEQEISKNYTKEGNLIKPKEFVEIKPGGDN